MKSENLQEERLIYPSFVTVYARPVIPGLFYSVHIAPGVMGLVTPFEREQQLKALKIIGGSVNAIKDGVPLTIGTLRNRLIKESDMEPYQDTIPNYQTTEPGMP